MASVYSQGAGIVGGGAATGAAIGAALTSWSGPGALIGASVGSAIGGIAGSIGIGNKAKKYAKKARRVQQERERNAQDAAYLQLIREARFARSGSLAASTTYGLATSSLATSALSSIGSQSHYSVQYTANDQRLVQLYNRYMKKAGGYAKAAQTTLATGQLASLAFGIGGVASGAFAGAASQPVGTVTAEQMLEGTTVGATEITPAMGLVYDLPTASSQILSSAQAGASNLNGLLALNLWTSFMDPIYKGVNQYNQI